MSKGDTIKIGAIVFRVLKREGQRLTLEWTESTGITKVRTIFYKGV